MPMTTKMGNLIIQVPLFFAEKFSEAVGNVVGYSLPDSDQLISRLPNFYSNYSIHILTEKK